MPRSCSTSLIACRSWSPSTRPPLPARSVISPARRTRSSNPPPPVSTVMMAFGGQAAHVLPETGTVTVVQEPGQRAARLPGPQAEHGTQCGEHCRLRADPGAGRDVRQRAGGRGGPEPARQHRVPAAPFFQRDRVHALGHAPQLGLPVPQRRLRLALPARGPLGRGLVERLMACHRRLRKQPVARDSASNPNQGGAAKPDRGGAGPGGPAGPPGRLPAALRNLIAWPSRKHSSSTCTRRS
jgi:hypothetical protein